MDKDDNIGNTPGNGDSGHDNGKKTDGYAGESSVDGQKKPFNRDGGVNRPFNRDSNANRPFNRDDNARKPFNRDGAAKPFNQNGAAKPFNRDGAVKPFNRDGAAKPFNRDGAAKPFNRDGAAPKPFNRDGAAKPFNRDGAPPKPFNRDGAPPKPFNRDGAPKPFNRDGAAKPFNRDGAPKQFNRDGAPKPFAPGARPANPVRPRPIGPAPARLLALEALHAVGGGAFSGIALNERIRAAKGLAQDDRRLATDLFYGVLENRLALDYALSQFMAKPCDDMLVRDILRMGAYQMMYLDRIPIHAAVSESVELAKRFSRVELAPMVNAVMRACAEGHKDIVWPEDPLENLSVRSSTPMWLVEHLCDDMGREDAEAFINHRFKGFYTGVRYNTLATDAPAFEDYLKREGIRYEEGVVPGCYRVQGGEIGAREGFLQGRFTIISEPSVLAALCVGARHGMHILDACAAPGGKTCIMAEMMSQTGRVHAWDIHEHRVRLIAEMARRMGLENIRPQMRDALEPNERFLNAMDAILVDAPCSNLGALAGKPDVKYRLKPEDLDGLPALQRKLLDVCAGYVKKGGALVYSTCTVLRAENQGVVAAFLGEHPQFELESMERFVPEPFKTRAASGMLAITPQEDDMEGFFIARMVKKRV